MTLFSRSQAKYYFDNIGGSYPIELVSPQELCDRDYKGITHLQEGHSAFDNFRSCLALSVEANLLLSASQYRRSLDLMVASSSHWAHVTLYYGSWYAAHALLGCYGGVVLNKRVVNVEAGTPGNQKLRIRRIGGPGGEQTTKRGSHRIFWEIFYRSIQPVKPYIDQSDRIALDPVSNDDCWQVRNRNLVNYDSQAAMVLFDSFRNQFVPELFPKSLPGALSTQFRISELLLKIAAREAGKVGIPTTVLSTGLPGIGRADIVRDSIWSKAAPNSILQHGSGLI